MITYFSVLAISAFGYLFFRLFCRDGSKVRYLMLIPFVVLLLFTENNPDYQVYRESFETGGGPYYETGIRIAADLLRKIGLNDYRFFLLIVAGLVFFAFRLWGRHISDIGVVILFYTQFILFYDVIQIRFAVAMMLVIISLYYAVERKAVPAVLFGICAVFFHRLSALACLMVLYIALVKPRKDYSLSPMETGLMLLIGLAGCVISRPLVNLIASRWSFFSRISMYMTTDVGYDSLIIWVGYELLLIAAIYFLGYWPVIGDPLEDDRTKAAVNKLFRFMLFGIAVSGFLLFVEEFNRMYRLFYLAGYLIFGLIEKRMPGTNRYILFRVICAINILFMVVAMLRGINFDLYW